MNDASAHLFEAVSSQREQVLSNFDSQRDAIIRAVEEQRLAAVQAAQGQTMPGRPIGARAVAPVPVRSATQVPSPQSTVAADIALTIKALVAEEVRGQLLALLQAADSKQKAAMGAPDAEKPPISAT